MAKMHSRKKGHSGSKRLLKSVKPSWGRYTAKEVEMLVAKLLKEGNSMSLTGLILRDSYGIPDVRQLTEKSIMQIAEEKKLLKDLPEDMIALMKKYVKLRKHLELNSHDMAVLRGLQLTESKIKRLVKYYKRTGKLEIGWKFNPDNVKMYTG